MINIWWGMAWQHGFSPERFSGYEGAAAVVKKILMFLHPDRAGGLNDLDFPPPEGYEPVRICRLTGKKADRFTICDNRVFQTRYRACRIQQCQQMLPIDKQKWVDCIPDAGHPLNTRQFIATFLNIMTGQDPRGWRYRLRGTVLYAGDSSK